MKMLNLFRLFFKSPNTVDTSYLVYLNTLEPISFGSKSDCLSYIRKFRSSSDIVSLCIYEIKTSLLTNLNSISYE